MCPPPYRRGTLNPVKKLPDDLSSMDATELSLQRDVRDDRLAPLFVRWPALTRAELLSLRELYRERILIAKHVGRRRLLSG